MNSDWFWNIYYTLKLPKQKLDCLAFENDEIKMYILEL